MLLERKILVVEDNEINRASLRVILSQRHLVSKSGCEI